MTSLTKFARLWGGLCLLGLALIVSGCADAPSPPAKPTIPPTPPPGVGAKTDGDKPTAEMPADGDQADPEAGSQSKSKAGGGKK